MVTNKPIALLMESYNACKTPKMLTFGCHACDIDIMPHRYICRLTYTRYGKNKNSYNCSDASLKRKSKVGVHFRPRVKTL